MNKKSILFRILLPSTTYLEVEAKQVNIPGSEGVFNVLPGHENFITSIEIGLISIFTSSSCINCYVYGGIIEVSSNEVNVMTEYAINTLEYNKNYIVDKIAALEKELLQKQQLSIESSILSDKIQKYKSLIKFL